MNFGVDNFTTEPELTKPEQLQKYNVSLYEVLYYGEGFWFFYLQFLLLSLLSIFQYTQLLFSTKKIFEGKSFNPVVKCILFQALPMIFTHFVALLSALYNTKTWCHQLGSLLSCVFSKISSKDFATSVVFHFKNWISLSWKVAWNIRIRLFPASK